jgi:endonuclease YncB( thermonuclease family)
MMFDLSPAVLQYAAIAVAGAGAVLLLLRMLRSSDPLPPRDPDCIWHTTVTRLDRVYDGDTFFARVRGHEPIDQKPVGIRVRGVDTPEIKSDKPSVKKRAEKARDFVEAELKNARRIHLYNVNMGDKYGRMLATVFCDRRDLAKLLVEKRLAKRYAGGRKKAWK